MRVIAPKRPTIGAARRGSTARLPEDIVAEQLDRLALFSIVSAALWAIALMLDVFVYVGFTRVIWIEAFGVLLAVAVFVYARFAPLPPLARMNAGLWLMVLNAAAIAAMETWGLDDTAVTIRNQAPDEPVYVSWIAIDILVTAMILPNTPRKMLAATLSAASMGPLGVLLAYLRGAVVPSLSDTALLYMANYVCAIAAVLPSQMFQGLGRQLREARELGNYELVNKLGQGGMGEVWHARHRWLARPAAIKLISPRALGATNAAEAGILLRRFEQEAQTIAALSSEHSIRLFDFGATETGSFYYAMELLAGRDLESLVREFGPFPAERALYLLRQVCVSLAEAHAKGLVHRDVKPANIFVCRIGLDYDFVKVLDFGLVQVQEREREEATSQSLIIGDRVLGTPGYLAPEVVLRKPVDQRADIYGLGCVAYFMLTGQEVFRQESLLEQVYSSPVRPSERANLVLPPSVDAFVLVCLEKDPANRPQDVIQVLNLIDACGVAVMWSSERAQEWWSSNVPDLTRLESVDVEADTDAGEEGVATAAETRVMTRERSPL
jgi:eukaryotic-like serine/threonine-protein kinase